MSAVKRSPTELDPAERPSKRACPKPPQNRRPAQVSCLRPVQPSAHHEVIYISSTSPDGTEDVRLPLPHMKPSGGIAPSDTLQDEPVNSIELRPPFRNRHCGFEHYMQITEKKDNDYAVVTASFDDYRRAAPPNAPAGHAMPNFQPQTLDLGPQHPQYDYNDHPALAPSYAEPIYKARTFNPVIALAIIRIAEKNLAYLNFDSTLAHLPNIGPQDTPVDFPFVEPGAERPFLDTATAWLDEEDDQPITVAFLPEFYLDGRHALAFWTRKAVSGRLCAFVCTPCTTQELRAAGLLLRVPVVDGPSDLQDTDGDDSEIRYWSDYRVAVSEGEWLYPTLEEDILTWERAEYVVGFEWSLRVDITTFPRVGVSEDSREARKRDSGLWGELRWD